MNLFRGLCVMLVFFACTTQRTQLYAPSVPQDPRIAVLPSRLETAQQVDLVFLDRCVITSVNAHAEATPVPVETVSADVRWQQGDDLAGGSSIGRKVFADQVLFLRVAMLDKTALLRLTLLDVQSGTVLKTAQANAQLQDVKQDLCASVAALIPTLFPPMQEDSARWYTSWWFLGGAGLVAAGGIIAATTLSSSQETRPPDLVVRPP